MARKAGNLRERFIVEYLIDLNATQAAIRAGYSPKTAKSQGQRLLTNVDLKNRIDSALAAQSERAELTADYVLKGIRETVERCRQAAPVLDREGNPVMIETPDGQMAAAFTFREIGALKGYELLGKHLKLFTEKHEVTIIDDREIAEAALQPWLEAGYSRQDAIEQVKQHVPEVAKLASELVQ